MSNLPYISNYCMISHSASYYANNTSYWVQLSDTETTIKNSKWESDAFYTGSGAMIINKQTRYYDCWIKVNLNSDNNNGGQVQNLSISIPVAGSNWKNITYVASIFQNITEVFGDTDYFKTPGLQLDTQNNIYSLSLEGNSVNKLILAQATATYPGDYDGSTKKIEFTFDNFVSTSNIIYINIKSTLLGILYEDDGRNSWNFGTNYNLLQKSQITYNYNYGNLSPMIQEKEYGDTNYRIASAPAREGYLFASWNTQSNGSGVSYNPGDIYSENADLDLYAIWIPKITKEDLESKFKQYIYTAQTSSPLPTTTNFKFTYQLVNEIRDYYILGDIIQIIPDDLYLLKEGQNDIISVAESMEIKLQAKSVEIQYQYGNSFESQIIFSNDLENLPILKQEGIKLQIDLVPLDESSTEKTEFFSNDNISTSNWYSIEQHSLISKELLTTVLNNSQAINTVVKTYPYITIKIPTEYNKQKYQPIELKELIGEKSLASRIYILKELENDYEISFYITGEYQDDIIIDKETVQGVICKIYVPEGFIKTYYIKLSKDIYTYTESNLIPQNKNGTSIPQGPYSFEPNGAFCHVYIDNEGYFYLTHNNLSEETALLLYPVQDDTKTFYIYIDGQRIQITD